MILKRVTQSIETYSWTDKPEISRHLAFIGILLSLSAIAFFKMKPYFTHPPKVTPFSQQKTKDSKTEEREKAEISKLGLETSTARNSFGSSSRPGGSLGLGTSQDPSKGHVFERPLFDGMTVNLKVVLKQQLNSAGGDDTVEAQIRSAVDVDSLANIDLPQIEKATLVGNSQPNFDTKRYLIRFSELITSSGRHFSVSGVAFEPSTQSLGVPANLASGVFSRIAGAALGRVISTADQIATQRVLQNSGDENAVARELNRTLTDSSSQAANDLSQEATRDLRDTRPVLSLPAGTTFIVKVKAMNGGKNGSP